MSIDAVIFDLGNTLIKQQIDDKVTLDHLQLEPLPGALDTLEQLHNRYRIGLLTNTVQSNQDHVLAAVAKLGLSPFIDCIVTSTDVGIKKPSGIMYQHILGCMGVRASNSIMVGNDLVADILGASQVGMTTVFYSCEMDDWNNLAKVEWQPNYVIERLPDLIPLLDQIQNST